MPSGPDNLALRCLQAKDLALAIARPSIDHRLKAFARQNSLANLDLLNRDIAVLCSYQRSLYEAIDAVIFALDDIERAIVFGLKSVAPGLSDQIRTVFANEKKRVGFGF